MKKLLFILFLFPIALMAQQEGHYSWFMQNQIMYNPAAAGSKNVPSFNAIYRQQWIGFEGAPTSQIISFDAPMVSDRVGVALSLRHLSIGLSNDWRAAMAYSYRVPLTPTSDLRIGLQGSIHYSGINFADDRIVTDKIGDASFADDGTLRQYNANVGAGIYYTYKNTIWVGLSSPGFYPATLGTNDGVLLTARETPHFYASAGALLEASDKLQLKPSIMFTYVPNAPLDMDVNVSAIFNNLLLLGGGYRLGGDDIGDSVNLLVGIYALDNMLIGGGYDYTLSELQDMQSGTFEVLLRYDLKSDKSDLENPRFFN